MRKTTAWLVTAAGLILLIFGGALFAEAGDDATAGDGAAGSITGRIAFEGDKPPSGLAVAETVVYLRGEGLASTAPAAIAPVVMDQRDITFAPHVVVVQVGGTLTIKNNDAIVHNVNSSGKVNPTFNQVQPAGSTTDVVFKQPEVVHVGCNIHSQMSAFIVVVPNRFFTMAARDGAFELKDVPPGKYTLVAWNERCRTFTTEVQVEAGKGSDAQVRFVASGSK